jgi:molybdopterin/thiamine biosynthesis adenylyltransferase
MAPRNRNLITPDEQKNYRAASVGIAGLSVGSAALATLVATGGPKHIRLADPDIVEITNLNRIRATLLDVGENKVVVAAHAAWEVDPFLAITCFEEGIQQETLQAFVAAKPKLRVFVDEMDNIEMKFLCREMCKKLNVPVVMATDNGDGAILDVERFDEEPDRPIFHGRVHIAPEERKNMSRAEFVKMANTIIDPVLFTTRQQQSIMEIGRSLSGVPQLGSAATLAGVAVAYAVRAITTGQKIPSGRYTIGCENAFIPGYDSKKEKKQRALHTKKFIAAFSSKGA